METVWTPVPNLLNIASQHWIEYQERDLDALTLVMVETARSCMQIAGRYDKRAAEAIAKVYMGD